MTRPNPTHGRHEVEGARAPRDDQRPDEGQTLTKPRSGSDQAKRDLDVIPEGEGELTDRDQDELGEDEDEALERE